jgi:uncharacterized membrane protein
MGILILMLLLLAGIAIFLYKKNYINKKCITITTIILIILFIIINVISYKPVAITEEEELEAIAKIHYENFEGYDDSYCETCYIYKKEDNTYYYFITSRHDTIAGPQEEKINKKGNINNKKQLEKIINKFEKKIKSNTSTTEYVTFYYNNQKIEKEDFISKMFND